MLPAFLPLGEQGPGKAQLCLLEVLPAQGSERNCVPWGCAAPFPCAGEQQLQPQYLVLLVQDELGDPAEDFIGAQLCPRAPISPLHVLDEGKEL